MELDPQAIARDLVRHLRGHRSQVQFSRRLGYSTNAVYSWEAGRRWPRASTFFHAVTRVGRPIVEQLERFYRVPPAWLKDAPGSATWVAHLLRDLRGNTPIGVLAERAGVSRFAVSRWLHGKAEPRLPEFLLMVEASSHRLLEFVSLFADPHRLPSTTDAWARTQALRALATESPNAQLVALGLELEGYRSGNAHSTPWLAQRLRLTQDEVETALTLLQNAGQLRFDGHYHWVDSMALDLRGSGTTLKHHWAKVASERIDEGRGMFSYNVFSVSERTLSELKELQRAHYRAVRALVATSSPNERVVLMNLHLVALDEEPSRTHSERPLR